MPGSSSASRGAAKYPISISFFKTLTNMYNVLYNISRNFKLPAGIREGVYFMKKILNYLKRVVWPAVYIALLVMCIWLLFVGFLHILLISQGDKFIISFFLPIRTLFVLGSLIIFTLALTGGHTIYRHSNGENWIKLRYLLPRSFS